MQMYRKFERFPRKTSCIKFGLLVLNMTPADHPVKRRGWKMIVSFWVWAYFQG